MLCLERSLTCKLVTMNSYIPFCNFQIQYVEIIETAYYDDITCRVVWTFIL